MKKNKYEDIQIIDLEDKIDDILDIYINRLYSTDKTVGIVVNKEIAEYFLDELVKIDETSIKEVCFVDNVDIDGYLVSVDDNGWIRVVPIDNHSVIDDVDIVYIDMDGDISQNVIDYYVNEDKEVILFGQKDDDCDCDGNCENCELGTDKPNFSLDKDEDGNIHGFTLFNSDEDGYEKHEFYSSDPIDYIRLFDLLSSLL